MTKQKGFYFRCTEQELQQLSAKAKERGQSRAKYILDQCIYNLSDNVYTKPKEGPNVYTNGEDVYTIQKKVKPAPAKEVSENKTETGLDVAALVARYKAKKTRSN